MSSVDDLMGDRPNDGLVDEVYHDLRESREWYEKKRDGLGDEFVDLFFDAVNDLTHGTHVSKDETGTP